MCASVNFSSNLLGPCPLAKYRAGSCGYLIKIKLKGQFDSCTVYISRAQKPPLTRGCCVGEQRAYSSPPVDSLFGQQQDARAWKSSVSNTGSVPFAPAPCGAYCTGLGSVN